jgi:GT2 family glycosyltransferase
MPSTRLPQSWSRLGFHSRVRTLSVSSQELEDATTDLGTLVEQELVDLDSQAREEIQQIILRAAAPDLDQPGAFSLGKTLYSVRERLREPLRQSTTDKDEPQAAQVESVVAVDETGFWITGWTRDEDGSFNRLVVVSPEGQRIELDEPFRLRRPDVEQAYGGSGRREQKHGFAAFFELPAPSHLDKGWILELRGAGQTGVQAVAPGVIRDPSVARDLLLAKFTEDQPNREEVRVKHLLPPLTRLQDRARRGVEIESVNEYGRGIISPTVSVVVTLYRRIDYLQHQLLHFAQDPTMRQVDLIYVLDSPELGGRLLQLAHSLYELHGVPFRIVRLTQNAGYATANNLGASLAAGRLLLLLNSDVIPDRPGWIEKMLDFYDATPDIGALGPKLLFEDGSIQHAGMYFQKDASGVWGNLHYTKGVASQSFGPASVARPVPAVTGACLMIDAALFSEMGGFSHLYMRGGYEDSELCLRLASRGRRNWYLGEVELYHLEGQVLPIPTPGGPTIFATWLQTHKWRNVIERLMADQAMAPEAIASTRESSSD